MTNDENKELYTQQFNGQHISPDTLIAGVDEVGRGALFGPVVAAAVVVPFSLLTKLTEIGVKDSKQLSSKRRSELVDKIKAIAESHGIASASPSEIDKINILQASLLAMKRAVEKLDKQPFLCLVDGRHPIPDLSMQQITMVKGDQRSPIIAAASILAKVWRDNLIIELATKYPEYDLAANKGYPTQKHRLALEKYGTCSEHRISFSPCR